VQKIFILVALLSITGCSKSEDKAGEGASATPGESSKKAGGPDFSAWDQAGKAKAWQGSWLAKDNGSVVAWTVTGDDVQTWNGTEEKSYKLVVEAPCHAVFKTDSGMMFPRNFSVVEGKLRYGAGGYRKGAEAIFCDDSGDIYVLDAASKCALWKEDFGKWSQSDGECSISKDAEGQEVFSHGDPNGGDFQISGDAIVPKASFPTEAVAGDFSAAKLARDAKAAE
jgi:hypothetical protein